MKALTILLILLTLFLGGTTFYYYHQSKVRTKVLADRELTITHFKKVINAIGQAGDIDVEQLKAELSHEFNFYEELGYYEYENQYYYVIYPKENAINHNAIWEFMGLELVLDNEKQFKTVSLHKP